jgi:hypothetical protein
MTNMQAVTTRVRALTLFPRIPNQNISKEGRGVKYETRVKPQSISTADYYLQLESCTGPAPTWFNNTGEYDLVAIVLEYKVSSLPEALNTISSFLDPIIDDLSFQLQAPLKVYDLEFLNVTAPVAVGDRREAIWFPFPGYDQLKLQRSTGLGHVVTARQPLLRESYKGTKDKLRQAVDWYIKALHASYDVDRFIFLWISFENLAKLAKVKVEEPTQLRCKHFVLECPECHMPTTEFRQGKSYQQYLAQLGITQPKAEEIWRMRQIVHGARDMTQPEIDTLTRLLPELREVVLGALKQGLGIEQNKPPYIAASLPTGKMALGISRPITAEDVFHG